MTDNEIIRALECCKSGLCNICGIMPFDGDCEEMISQMSLDLINRQKAEIEAWKETAETAEKAFESWHRTAELDAKKIIELKAEIEKLEYYLDCECSSAADVGSMLVGEEKAKAEAVKEFADMVNKEVDRKLNEEWICEPKTISSLHSIKHFVDNLVKEMVGVV